MLTHWTIRRILFQLNGSLGHPQRGAASLTSAIIISGVLLAGVTAVQRTMNNKQSFEAKAVDQYYLETANETAIAITAQLLGNSTIIPIANAFMLNPNQTGMNSSNWSFSNGKLHIPSCLRSSKSIAADTIYADNNQNSQLLSCDDAARAVTIIEVQELLTKAQLGANSLAFTEFKSGQADDYVLVKASTTLGANTKSKTARLRFMEATKVCNSIDPNNPNACNVDHCKFMKPLRDANGRVMYKASGAAEIEVNELFSERIRLIESPAQTAIQKVNSSDPIAMNLFEFYNAAYKRGRLDPFREWQSVKPTITETNFVKIEPDGSIWLDIQNSVAANSGVPGTANFDGFLFYNPATDLSDARPWPAGERYSSLAKNFKEGCKRTIGSDSPDLCARINVNLLETRYSYGERRFCRYQGPENYPGFLAKNLKDWDGSNSKSFQEFSAWRPSKENKVGEEIIDNKRKVWVDNLPHHEFGPSPGYALHQSVGHVFSDIEVGTVKTREVKSEWVDFDAQCGGAANEGDCKAKSSCDWKNDQCQQTQDKKETYLEREKLYTWQTSCESRKPTGADSTAMNLSLCFYITYTNIESRTSCQRAPSTAICRNLNGCFIGGTKILMADGSEKAIEDVKEADMVYNPTTRQASKVHKTVVGEEKRDLYEVVFDGGKVTATFNHPFILKSGLTTAEKLSVGDLIIDKDLQTRRIESIKKIKPAEGTMVWNLLLANPDGTDSIDYANHTFVANGLSSGDFFVQQSAGFMTKEYEQFTAFIKAQENKASSR